MSGAARLFSPSPKRALTTILYHRFIAPDESLEESRTRLKFQLEWLKEKYTPLCANSSLDKIENGSDLPYPLHVTADDAYLDLLDVQDIFSEFEIPLTIFVCTGWVDNNEDDDFSSLARIADFIRWYRGETLNIEINEHKKLSLSEQTIDDTLEQIIQCSEKDDENFVQKIWDQLKSHRPADEQRLLCNWRELNELNDDSNITIGSHSVTHCALAEASTTRLKFELEDSKSTLESRIGKCEHFAYPFGTNNVVNKHTTNMIEKAGYKSAYLTHAGFADQRTNPLQIPRIVIPDHKISTSEFRSRVTGGTIALEALQRN